MLQPFILILLIVLLSACGLIFNSSLPGKCNYTATPFGGGSGTQADPYTICTVAHLMQVQNHLSSSFKQYADLDLAGNTTFTPIGSTGTPFIGNYDGNGGKISNWTYGDSTLSNVGLFGVISRNAEISNLNLVNFNLTGNTNVGLLVGSSDSNSQSIQINNCASSGIITALSSRSGGLIGILVQGTVTQSSSQASVSGWTDVGGLIGEFDSGQITDSFSLGSISASRTTGPNYIGGLIGSLRPATQATILRSYSKSSVNGANNTAGGLIGRIWTTPVTISDSYATGNVSASANVGGLIGQSAAAQITRCYATGSLSANSNIGGLVALTSTSAGTSLTVSNSYSLSSIAVTGSGLVNGGGILGSASGTITVDRTYAKGTVTGSTGGQRLGGFAGNLSGTVSISNSYATGNVLGQSSTSGGFAAAATGSGVTFSNCYSTGIVTGSSFVGGFLGFCSSCGSVTNSYWDTTTSGVSSSATVGEQGFTTSQMQTQSSYTGWDFTSIWNPPPSGSYPTLR